MAGLAPIGRPRGARRGFSLIVVLLVSLAGLSLLGGIVYMIDTSSGSSRFSVSQDMEYNVMQRGVEEGKAELRRRVAAVSVDLPHWSSTPDESIPSSLSSLLIPNGTIVDRTVPGRELGGNKEGRLTVNVYDLRYDASKVPNNAALIMTLPPSIQIGGTPEPPGEIEIPGESPIGSTTASNAAAYLVRASLVIGGHRKVLDTIVIQSKKE